MTTISATEARKQLYKLLDEVSQSHEPIQITGKRGSAVLVSEDDWRACRRRSISYRSPACASRSSRAWRRPSMSSKTSSTGELATGLQQPGGQGREEARRRRSEAERPDAPRRPPGGPAAVASALRGARR